MYFSPMVFHVKTDFQEITDSEYFEIVQHHSEIRRHAQEAGTDSEVPKAVQTSDTRFPVGHDGSTYTNR